MKNLIFTKKTELVKSLWEADSHIKKIFFGAGTLHETRDKFFDYLNNIERHYFNIYSDKHFKKLHVIEKNNAKECIRVLKNIIRTENEQLTHFSAFKKLFNIAKNKETALSDVNEGFLCEFISLFRGINGKTGITPDVIKFDSDDERASLIRSEELDKYSETMRGFFEKYKVGTDKGMVKKRQQLKNKILKFFRGTDNDWDNYHWHLKHIIKDVKTLSSLIKLEKDELNGLKLVERYNIPFQITPYYLSLFNEDCRDKYDRTVRAQVIPSATYCLNVVKNGKKKQDMDFMGEKSTSPIDGITRRYPQIVILKPFDSCPQICVYCQRNWEIKKINDTQITSEKIKKAIEWIKNNENITEVLVTGGDPLTLNNNYLDRLLNNISKIKHIERIRIGTRILVTLPYRIDSDFIKIISKYHELGKREICIVTHFEHPSEITQDSIEAIKKIRNAGISIYNQQVFTYFNSFKFETAVLRKALKLAGVDPYYTFNTKGKEETIDFRVPIARIEQERKEEARFLPGLVRTDEPVFNVPKLGKSHLRAWQNHEIVMILNTGQRVYRFYPWESKVATVDDYLYTDVSIYDYLKRLADDKENISDYCSIWYYF